MKKLLLSMATVPLIIGGLSVSASAADNGLNILNDIKVKGEIRPRFETAEVSNNGKDKANALTARTTLSITGTLFDVKNLTTTVGIASVNNFGYTKYNSTSNGHTQYDVIVDPQQAMISEASVDYKTGKTALHAGRSHVNLDNQRFIGTVGWRQMERSYDSVYVADNSVENLNLLAAWVYGFQGVKEQAEAIDTNTVLLHLDYKVMDELSITAYDYMIANTHDTMGIALSGKVSAAGAKINYRAEYAVQKDATMKIHTQTPTTGKASANYMNIDVSANINGLLAGVNYEVLSGAKGSDTTFTPTLGTNHKFNGWADVFYVASNPSGGLKDANIHLGYKAKGFGKFVVFYHDFKADTDMAATSGNTDDLGSEIDAVYVNKISAVKNLKGLVKYAQYSAGKATGYTNDKKVAWLMLDYKFSVK